MKAFRSTTKADRPGNRVNASAAPRGMPTKAASATAVRLTMTESRTIANRAGSPLRMSCHALN